MASVASMLLKRGKEDGVINHRAEIFTAAYCYATKIPVNISGDRVCIENPKHPVMTAPLASRLLMAIRSL